MQAVYSSETSEHVLHGAETQKEVIIWWTTAVKTQNVVCLHKFRVAVRPRTRANVEFNHQAFLKDIKICDTMKRAIGELWM
jgi:hypothetical protein